MYRSAIEWWEPVDAASVFSCEPCQFPFFMGEVLYMGAVARVRYNLGVGELYGA